MALVVEWEIPTFAYADPLAVSGPTFYSTSALIFPSTDMVVVLEFTFEVDFFSSNTQALESAPSNSIEFGGFWHSTFLARFRRSGEVSAFVNAQLDGSIASVEHP